MSDINSDTVAIVFLVIMAVGALILWLSMRKRTTDPEKFHDREAREWYEYEQELKRRAEKEK